MYDDCIICYFNDFNIWENDRTGFPGNLGTYENYLSCSIASRVFDRFGCGGVYVYRTAALDHCGNCYADKKSILKAQEIM